MTLHQLNTTKESNKAMNTLSAMSTVNYASRARTPTRSRRRPSAGGVVIPDGEMPASSPPPRTPRSSVPAAGVSACSGDSDALVTLGSTRKVIAAAKGAVDTAPLDGLRAVLNITVMAFHALCFVAHFLPDEDLAALRAAVPFWEHGYAAVDGTLVLSGFLIAYPLLLTSSGRRPATSRKPAGAAAAGVSHGANVSGGGTAGKLTPADALASVIYKARDFITSLISSCRYEAASGRLADYYAARFLRIMLPLVALVVLHCFITSPCGEHPKAVVRNPAWRGMADLLAPGGSMVFNQCNSAWAALLHISNFTPFNGTFMHVWSVGTVMLAYLAVPLLWERMRLAEGDRLPRFVLACVVASFLLRAMYHLHLARFNDGVLGAAMHLFWYSHAIMRSSAIAIGMGAAWVSARSQWPAWLELRGEEQRKTRTLCWAIVALYAVLTLKWQTWFGDPRFSSAPHHALYTAAAAAGGPLAGAAWAWVLLSVLHRVGGLASVPARGVADAATRAGTAGWESRHEFWQLRTRDVERTPAREGQRRERGAALWHLRNRWVRSPAGSSREFTGKGDDLAEREQQPSSTQRAEPSPGISHPLSTPTMRFLGDLSYWAYLIHPIVFVKLFSSPALLYPPASTDALPHASSNSILLDALYALREAVWPTGRALGASGLLVLTIVSIGVVYVVSAMLMLGYEQRLRRWLLEKHAPVVKRFAWYYCIGVLVLATAAHTIGTVYVVLSVDAASEPEFLASLGDAAARDTVLGALVPALLRCPAG